MYSATSKTASRIAISPSLMVLFQAFSKAGLHDRILYGAGMAAVVGYGLVRIFGSVIPFDDEVDHTLMLGRVIN